MDFNGSKDGESTVHGFWHLNCIGYDIKEAKDTMHRKTFVWIGSNGSDQGGLESCQSHGIFTGSHPHHSPWCYIRLLAILPSDKTQHPGHYILGFKYNAFPS